VTSDSAAYQLVGVDLAAGELVRIANELSGGFQSFGSETAPSGRYRLSSAEAFTECG
jgi:hypothetical protein